MSESDAKKQRAKFGEGLNWLAIHAYASQRIRARYAGSALGEFWMVITTTIFLIAVAVVWSQIWDISLDDYFAYFATGFIFYNLIAGTMNEAAGVIIGDSRLYLNAKLSPLFSIAAHIYRSLLGFAHHLIIVLVVLVAFVPTSLWNVLLALLGTFLCLLFLFPASYLLAMVSVRYRDLLHVIHSLFQIMFLVTPVMWKIERIPEEYRPWLFLNPVAGFLNITRDALLGLPVYSEAVISVVIWVAVAWILYWLARKGMERHFSVWL